MDLKAELKSYERELEIKKNVRTYGLTQLEEILSNDFQLLKTEEENTYEMVIIKPDGTMSTQIEVETPQDEKVVNITEEMIECLMTGTVSLNRKQPDSQLHLTPLPVYHLDYYKGRIMPCVELKNGKRAMAEEVQFYPGI